MILRFALTLAVFASSAASAEVLFEAFFRIEKDRKHLGYLVQRLAQNPQTKLKTLITFVHTRASGQPVFETIRSVARDNLTPVESFRGGNRSGSRTDIAAYFKDGKAWTELRNHGARRALDKSWLNARQVPFQSSFLFYVADLGQLQKGKNYAFHTYSERAGRAAYGQLSLEAESNAAGMPVRHVVLDMLGEPQENFVTRDGDPVGARSPGQGTIAYWVKTKAEAIGDFEYPSRELISLFGDLPEGKKNPWFNISGFNAKSVVNSFRKSYGTRSLASAAREKITVPLPIRKGKGL